MFLLRIPYRTESARPKGAWITVCPPGMRKNRACSPISICRPGKVVVNGMIVLVVSHDREFIEKACDRIFEMDGRRDGNG